MATRALLTGGAGFVGQWLVRALVEEGWHVVSASTAAPPTASVALSQEMVRAITWLHADVRCGDDVARIVAEARPDVVFHLAGVTFVPDAQGAPEAAYEVNVLGAVRLLHELVRARAAGLIDPTVIVVGSGAQYGRHSADELPLVEEAELRPADVYAASKAAQELASLQVYRSHGLRVICTRSFNHSGPGHPSHFLLPALVRRALSLPEDGQGTLRIGNQDSVRDFLHVADVVDAYCRLARLGSPGDVYNVCSGEGVTVRQLASDVLLRVGRTAEIITDPALARGVDVPALVGSPAKLQRATDWRPTRTRAQIIDDLINAATN